MADTSRYDQHVGQDFIKGLIDSNREKNRKALEAAVLIVGAEGAFNVWRKYHPKQTKKGH